MGHIRIIAGKWRGRLINVVEHPTLRPTPNRVRETLFNWLQFDIVDANCLDLFAGTGVLGFEALSRGAKKVTFVEIKDIQMMSLRQTVNALAVDTQCHIFQKNAITWLKDNQTSSNAFDIIFLDPPFNTPLLNQSIALLSQSTLIKENTLIYIESAYVLSPENLPPRWNVIKNKSAGEVFYHLAQIGQP